MLIQEEDTKMSIGTMFVVIYSTYEIRNLIEIFLNKKLRENSKTINRRLEQLRLIKNKTMEEQKEFLDLAYPKTGKFKFSFKMLLNIVIYIFQFLVLMYFINMGVAYMKWDFSILQAIVIIMICPLIIGWILKKFKLNKHEPLLQMLK